MMKPFPTVLACLFWSTLTPLNGQFSYTVISTNGLKLRAAPDRESAVLAVVPFGADVAYEGESFGSQTLPYEEFVRTFKIENIGTAWLEDTLRGNGRHYIRKGRHNDFPIPHLGRWLPVSYGGKRGYMFSGFLKANYGFQADTTSVGDFYLREEGAHFGGKMPLGKVNWYAVLKKKNGDFEVKKVELRYLTIDNTLYQSGKTANLLDPEPGYGELTYAITDMNRPVEFLIGTRKSFPERIIKNAYCDAQYVDKQLDSFFVSKISRFDLALDPLPDSYGIPRFKMKKARGNFEPVTIECKNPQEDGKDVVFVGNASRLVWAGDLDGDNKVDYIFDVPLNYAGSKRVLMLSSQAKTGEKVRIVAEQDLPECC